MNNQAEDGPGQIDDAEVLRREIQMDSGAVHTISEEEFLARVGRARPREKSSPAPHCGPSDQGSGVNSPRTWTAGSG